MDQEIRLAQTWRLGEIVGRGGYGTVYAAVSDDPGSPQAVLKLIRKHPGGDRELLFVDLPADIPNIIPILDSGETPEAWVLLMPRADMSLREHLRQNHGSLSLADAVSILVDICDALVGLDGKVVHRDLKPENILLLNGKWCLTDFGIARYADATTAPDTHKLAKSAPYASPEQWREERATSASDVYAFGIIAFEIITGRRPFPQSDIYELRDAHLFGEPPPLEGAPSAVSALVEECVYKAPGARPSPANIRQRLGRFVLPGDSPGLALLQDANLAQVRENAEIDRRRSTQQSKSERRAALDVAARQSFSWLSDELRTRISENASAASWKLGANSQWRCNLGRATLILESVETAGPLPVSWSQPPFDVICVSSIQLVFTPPLHGYSGRSHSLWYCDAANEGEYQWFETAFMNSPILGVSPPINPFAMKPEGEAVQALRPVLGTTQVAWSFTPLVPGETEEFVGRWGGWLAKASRGQMEHPQRMPEHHPVGGWRKS